MNNKFAILHELEGTQFLIIKLYNPDEDSDYGVSFEFWSEPLGCSIKQTMGFDNEDGMLNAMKQFEDISFCEKVRNQTEKGFLSMAE